MTEPKLALKWERVDDITWIANTPLFPIRVVLGDNLLWHVAFPSSIHKVDIKNCFLEDAKLHAEYELFRRIDQCLKLKPISEPVVRSQPWQSLADVPLDAWLRRKGTKSFERISGVDDNGDIEIGDMSCTLQFMHDNCEWSYAPTSDQWWPCDMEHTI